jgi:hypothetical protein
MGLKSTFKKALKVTGISFVLKQFGSLLSALLPKVKIPKSLEQGSSTYDANARINSSKLGDIKPVVYGQAWVWPPYCSMPYKYFEGHDQILAAYVHITVGYCQIPIIRIGDTSATRFPGFIFEILPPGEDMELILPNVYTCPEVEGVELLGGGMDNTDTETPHRIVTVKFYEEGTTSIDATAGTFTSDTDEAFVDFILGDEILVYDAGANNGQYTITEIGDDYKTIKTDPAPASTTTQTDIGFFVQRRWAGPYPTCPPGDTVHTVAFDFVFAALLDKDNPDDERTVSVKVQCRKINDVGTPIDDLGDPIDPADWSGAEEADFVFTDNVNRVRRYTVEFIVEDEARYEARVWRETYEQADQEDPSSAAQWVGLKGYIVAKPGDTPFSDPDSTRLAVLIRSSGTLSSQSENALNCLVQRQLPVYESGGWSDPAFTRNPAWADVDWLTNHSQGAITLAQLDVDSFVQSAATADVNEDTFDAVFDREVGLKEGADSILRVARSKMIFDPFTRLYKVYRDEPSDPVMLFCDGFNCTTGTDSIALPDADTVTGVYVTFMNPLLWTEREGPTVGTDDDPRKVRGFGFTSWDAVWREASFQYRDIYYRNHTVSISTEMEGLLPIHGNRILLASSEKGWGHGGEVVEQDGTTLRVFPAPVWTVGMSHYVYLQDDDGVPQGPFTCSQGVTADILMLDEAPGLTLRTGAGLRSLFAFGHDGDSGENADAPRVAIVMERTSGNSRTASLQLLFDHDYVHEDPGPAPEDPYDSDSTIPDLTLDNLAAEQVVVGDVLTDPEGSPLADPEGDFLLEPGGAAGGVVLTATWDAEPGATSYQLRWKYIGVPGWHYASTIGTSLTFAVPTNGTVRVLVKALSTTYVGPESEVQVVIDAYP